MKAVGTLFIENEKLLLDKPRKRPTHQLVGGRVEENETPLEAAIREAHEELGNEAIFDENALEQVLEFDEIATSDGVTPIHFYVFMYKGKLEALTFDKSFFNASNFSLSVILSTEYPNFVNNFSAAS